MMRPHKSKTNVIVILYVVLLSALIFQAIRQSHLVGQIEKERQRNVAGQFANINFEAKAVYVFDTSSGKALWGAHSHVPLPLASVVKIATAVCTLDKLGMESAVTVSASDLYKEINGLVAGDVWRTEDLVTFMLIESSNNAAKTLARAYGGEKEMVVCMNNLARRFELFDTKFANSTGLDLGTTSGGYGSAEDAVKLLLGASKAYPEIFERTAYKSYNVTSLNGRLYEAINTDRAIDDISGLMASKTGYTELAGGNLVFTMDAGLNHKIAIAILGSSEEGRFKDAVTLSTATIKALAE